MGRIPCGDQVPQSNKSSTLLSITADTTPEHHRLPAISLRAFSAFAAKLTPN